MSYTPIEHVAKSSQELEALVKDVQGLLHAHQAAKAENVRLKAQVAAQDRLMELAHNRLMSMLKRLPEAIELTATPTLNQA